MTDVRMVSLFLILSAGAALAAPAAAPGAPPAAAPAPPAGPEAVASLAWMQGSWAGDDGGTAMEEYWTAPRGGALLGLHRDVKGERMVWFDFQRIDASGGVVTYWASPKNAPPTPFRLKEMGPGRRVVFENLEHDFPQRILYWMTDEDELHARIEGPAGGAEKDTEWTWKRSRPR